MKSQHLGFYKVIYLLMISIMLFVVNNMAVMAGLFTLQLGLWIHSNLALKPYLRALFKLKWFFLIIGISFVLMPQSGATHTWILNLYWFDLTLYPSGLMTAALMLMRIALMLMVSLWVRMSSTQTQFIGGLKAVKVPETVAMVIDLSLHMLTSDKPHKNSSKGGKTGQGQGRGQAHKTEISLDELKTSKNGFIDRLIQTHFMKSQAAIQKTYPDMLADKRQDIIIILTVVAAIMSLKVFQMLPGLPIAPGHKNIVIIPLIMLASLTTHMRYGGFAAGFATGVVSFFMGFGKFGVFEVLHFALPGLVADWLVPFIRHSTGKMLMVKLMMIGGLIGLTRFAANFAILLLAGAPILAWVVFIPMLISQIVFGALSSFVCLIVLKKHRKRGWFTSGTADNNQNNRNNNGRKRKPD